MIEQTRKRFILVSMVSFSIVLFVVLMVLNGLNYWQTTQRLDHTASLFLGGQDQANGQMSPKQEGGPNPTWQIFGPNQDREWKFSTRFIKVVADPSSLAIQEVNTDQVSAITDDQARILAQSLLEKGASQGWSNGYRFAKSEINGQLCLIMIDATRELSSMINFLAMTLVTFLVCLLVVYGLLIFFSHKAIQPLLINIERQKEFISNASHEIKTPLAILSANNDVLALTDQKDKWIASNKRQIQRLNHLVEQMLLLSRYDEGKASIHLETLNFRAILDPILEEFQNVFAEQEIRVEAFIPGDLTVTADRESLKKMITILLENAVKYLGTEKIIAIRLTKNHPTQVSFLNSCYSMTREECEQVFDRFFRADSSRSQQTGSGMGLSIAKAMAKLNKIDLTAQLHNPQLIDFSMTFKA